MTDSPSLVLSGAPHRWGWVALGCGLFILLGATIGLSGHYVVIGWAIAAVFAALLVVALRQTGNPDHLLLHDESFDVLHAGTTVTRDFESCSEFSVWREGSLNLVIFDHPLDDAKPHAAENRRLTGRTGSLPHRFGVRAEELAQLLNMARSRALGLEPAETEEPEAGSEPDDDSPR
ncbi:MAG: hypothetical protein ABMA25_00235 [Ilumatobacteraceae bacterium]